MVRNRKETTEKSKKKLGLSTQIFIALLAGALLIVWCAFELVYLPNPVSVIYLVIGLVQTACAAVMRPAR